MSQLRTLFQAIPGMRFDLRGAEFEVAYVGFGAVRYAAVCGGKQYRVTQGRFIELQTEGELTVLNADLWRQQVNAGLPTLATLNEDEFNAAIRQLKYAETALMVLPHPNSIRLLTEWIPEFAQSIQDNRAPSARTVSSWVKKLAEDGKDAFMAPTRRRGNRSLRFSPEIEVLLLSAVDSFLVEEHRDSKDVLAYIVGHLAEQNLLTKDGSKVKVPSERTIRRKLAAIDPFLLIRIKKGHIAAEQAARAAGKNITSPRPLYIVQIDTHYLDIFVVDPDTMEILGRPYLVCAKDVHTRCVVGTFISMFPPSATTTLGAIKDMLTRPNRGLPGGICVVLIPDNGVDFKNSGVVRVCSKLGINFQPAEVRDPNDKAHVESFFRTLTLFLIQKIKGTTFSNPKARGDYPSEKRAFATLDQLTGYINFWIENEYHVRPHSMTGRAPIRMWEESTARAKPLALLEVEADAISRRPKRCAIGKGRVRVHHEYYYSHALKTLEQTYDGLVTVLYDELDMEHVFVEHPYEKGVLIQADSINPEYTHGLTLWQHEEARKLKAKMTQQDITALGQYADVLARYQLLQTIQKDSQRAKRKLAKLTQGKGREQEAQASSKLIEDGPLTPPSQLAQQLGVNSLGMNSPNTMQGVPEQPFAGYDNPPTDSFGILGED
ncbi:DDE-type integrase/transposase/recombinase [Chitinolyticbacter meiyuanensis]|uniref:DDE-type integrase/transposase/recombinase n=1 Tax=Chitinolyticbacter meiyuanensis TaxID=682798 RepID=UPI0011E5C3AE|nr:DDE-type integrase/transposase/recombinase [Chitinolyticbacter meiyuanensis]